MRPYLAIVAAALGASCLAYDVLGPDGVEAGPASSGDAGSDGGVEPCEDCPRDDAGSPDGGAEGDAGSPDAGLDAGPVAPASWSRICDDGSDVPSDAGVRVRCAGLATIATPPAAANGVRLREPGFQLGMRLCKDVGGIVRCVTGGIAP